MNQISNQTCNTTATEYKACLLKLEISLISLLSFKHKLLDTTDAG